jgi:uncharacterized oligopeptide transporter (OPT) family protein
VTGEQLITVGAVLAGLGMLMVWSSGARAGRRSERAVREVTRVSGALARTVVAAGVITGAQWAVVSLTGSPVAWAVALGLPALFAGATVSRLLAVTQVIRVVHDSRRTRR